MSFIQDVANKDDRSKGQIKLWLLLLEVIENLYGKNELYNIFDGLAIMGVIIEIKEDGFILKKNPKMFSEKEWQDTREEYLIPFQFEIINALKVTFQRMIDNC